MLEGPQGLFAELNYWKSKETLKSFQALSFILVTPSIHPTDNPALRKPLPCAKPCVWPWNTPVISRLCSVRVPRKQAVVPRVYIGRKKKKVWSDWVYFRMRTIILGGKYIHYGLQTTCSCPLPWGLGLERGLPLDQKEPWTSTVWC